MFMTIYCNFLNPNQLGSDLLFPLSSTELWECLNACIIIYFSLFISTMYIPLPLCLASVFLNSLYGPPDCDQINVFKNQDFFCCLGGHSIVAYNSSMTTLNHSSILI